MWRRTERASLEKKLSTRLSHEHDELSQLICDRSIKGLAVGQQFYDGT